MQLTDQNVEGFRHARFRGGFALHNGLVNLGAAINVIRFGGEQFLQNIGGAISFQRPDFHFSKALSTELRLAAQRLLRDERIRSDGPGVDLVVHQVRQLEHIDITDRDRLLKRHSRNPIVQLNFA